jgi:adrenodoxin-NADP+ reductase
MLRTLASATRDRLLRQARSLTSTALASSYFNSPAAKQSDPRRFCVVGSGPAGMYAADRLLAAFGDDAKVDVIEKLPTPFGLVRSGVAPDHAGTKSVVNRFDNILKDPRVEYLGNVSFGEHVGLDDLFARYSATVLCYGAEGDKKLNVPGEDMPGSHSAREFVGWYNGDPRCVEDLDGPIKAALTGAHGGDTAVIFGLGNVAVDCARMLLRSPAHLAATDVCEHALEALRTSSVRRVVMVGRRGVAQAAFSPKELRELLNLPGVTVTVDPTELTLAPEDEADLAAQRPRRRAYEAIVKSIESPPAGTEKDKDGTDGGARELVLKFLRSPAEFTPNEDDGVSVGAVTLGVNKLQGVSGSRRAVPTGDTERLDRVSLVLRSVGYKGAPAKGVKAGFPFDLERGVVPNVAGRVMEKMGGYPTHVTGMYVAGWLKRGPYGIIGTNLQCAEETVGSIAEDAAAGRLRRPDYRFKGKGVRALVESRGVKVVDAEGWARIDAAERAAGEAIGKPREKMVSVDEMVALGGRD